MHFNREILRFTNHIVFVKFVKMNKMSQVPTSMGVNFVQNIVQSVVYVVCRFYMPHGLTIDAKGNYWITDVAMHQVE